MDRRQALKLLTLFAGGSIALPAYAERLLHYPDTCWALSPPGIAPEQTELLAALADTILPRTDTPGASDAGVQHILPILANDCLDAASRDIFWAGLEALDATSRSRFQTGFAQLSPERRTLLLSEAEQAYKTQRSQPNAGPHFFKIAKDLTLTGYFTSETGATQALRYLPIPGKWEADLPYTAGEKAWAL